MVAFLTLHVVKISQPSVSQAVRELEDHYGTKLFLTVVGEELLQYARHIADLVNQSESAMRDFADGSPLRIGVTLSVGESSVPNAFHYPWSRQWHSGNLYAYQPWRTSLTFAAILMIVFYNSPIKCLDVSIMIFEEASWQMKKEHIRGILLALVIAIPAWLLGKQFPIIGGPVFGASDEYVWPGLWHVIVNTTGILPEALSQVICKVCCLVISNACCSWHNSVNDVLYQWTLMIRRKCNMSHNMVRFFLL